MKQAQVLPGGESIDNCMDLPDPVGKVVSAHRLDQGLIGLLL